MSREETIDRWAEYIVPAVLTAENRLQATFKAMRDSGEKLTQEKYCRMVAEEIVSGTFNKQDHDEEGNETTGQ